MTFTPSTAKTMKAVYFERRASPSNPMLSYGDVPRPEPGEGELLVRVHATSIMSAELGWRTTWETRAGVPRVFPVIPGHEFSGLVAAMGAGVRGLDIGEEVYGMNDWDSQGAQAEYCLKYCLTCSRGEPSSIGTAITGDAGQLSDVHP